MRTRKPIKGTRVLIATPNELKHREAVEIRKATTEKVDKQKKAKVLRDFEEDYARRKQEGVYISKRHK